MAVPYRDDPEEDYQDAQDALEEMAEQEEEEQELEEVRWVLKMKGAGWASMLLEPDRAIEIRGLHPSRGIGG